MATLVSSTINNNTILHAGISGVIIDRGNPGSGSPLLLDKLGVVHYYHASSVTLMDISTRMEEDSMYELFYCFTDNSAENSDPVLYPNYTSYSSQFASYFWGSPGFTLLNQTANSGFYTDHYAGGSGNLANGRYILFNRRSLKQILYQGGDTASNVQGGVRWNNNTTQWLDVGRLQGFQSGTMHVWVRRIG